MWPRRKSYIRFKKERTMKVGVTGHTYMRTFCGYMLLAPALNLVIGISWGAVKK